MLGVSHEIVYLQEVFRAAVRRRGNVTISFGDGGEYGEFRFEVLSEIHDGGDVAAAVAVIGGAPDGDDGLVFKMPLCAVLALAEPIEDRIIAYLITFIDKLMGTRNKLESVDVVEFRGDLIAKQPSSTTWRYSPSSNIFRITPNQITESTFMRDLLSSSNDAYLIKGTDLRT